MTAWVNHAGLNGEYEADFLKNSHIGISYNCRIDLTTLPKEEFFAVHRESPRILWDFFDGMRTGDLVVVPFRNSTVAVGEVQGEYAFRPTVDPHHVRSVRWIAQDVADHEVAEDLLRSIRNQPGLHRIKTSNAEARIRELAKREADALDAYIKKAQIFIRSGQLESEELDYKTEIAEELRQAREAVNAGDSNWPSMMRRALNNNLSHWLPRAVLTEWFEAETTSAQQAILALWDDSSAPVADRIRAFLAQAPDEPKFKGTGTRLREVAALLMALDAVQYPPFKIREFQTGFDATGYGRPSQDADEGAFYEHTLAFLDRLLERTRQLGFERPANRLEAQSVVWMMAGASSEEPSDESTDDGEEPVRTPEESAPPNLETLAAKLLLEPSFLRNIKRLLDEKGQIVFQGPPGTGKTYVARELARALAGADERVRLVQFHPSYAYEDFVQGYRPRFKDGQAGFELRDGPLVQAANEARNSAANYYLIIDEINRGNLAKVFGELYFLLEYRDQQMRLQYAKEEDEDFSLPENLYIIGTMNTADRSIALVDLALRRRFSFVEFHPEKAPVEGLLGRWLERKESDLPWIAKVVDLANTKLDNREAAIGPSYFMKDDLDEERVGRIWEHDVLPYIEEQLYGQHERLAEFALDTLRREAAGDSPDAGDDATGEQEDEPGSGDANA